MLKNPFRYLTSTLVLFLLTSVAWSADFNWKCQSFWQAGTTNQKAFEQFAADVNEKSDGRIEIETLSVGTIVPPGEMLDALNAGILNCMNAGTGYFVGKDPAFALLADFNAGYENPEQLTQWFWEGGGIDLARDLYGQYGAFYVGPVMWGAESIPTKNPLRNIKDFDLRPSLAGQSELVRGLRRGCHCRRPQLRICARQVFDRPAHRRHLCGDQQGL
jgi:TRAP-type C4-dicarboxylate transport system substrate-binding protein